MRLIDKIRSMSPDQLADFLIIKGETTYDDENEDGRLVSYSEDCWITPWGEYPHWWNYLDVKESVIEKLMSGG